MTVSHKGLGLLFILVAPAGAGKNALMNRVKARVSNLVQLPTATTRPIREGEQQGREHLYVNHQEFQDMIDNNALLEWQEVHGQRYGVPRATVEQAIASGQDMIADIEYLGANYIRALYPEHVVLIFIQPPSIPTLVKRMRHRGETEAEISKRLMRVPTEMAYAPKCDYLIVNDDIEHAADTLYGIVLAERSHRDILRLRGSEQSTIDAFTYTASVIVMYNNEVLCRDQQPNFPTDTIQKQEPPYETAMRILREQLDIHDPSAHGFFYPEQPRRDEFPPIYVNYVDEQVNLLFAYPIDHKIEPPPGWGWHDVRTAVLPSQVMEMLSTSQA